MFYGHDFYCKIFSGVYFYNERNARLSIFTSLYFPSPFASSRVGRISEIRTKKVHIYICFQLDECFKHTDKIAKYVAIRSFCRCRRNFYLKSRFFSQIWDFNIVYAYIRKAIPWRAFINSVCEIVDKEYGEVEKVSCRGVLLCIRWHIKGCWLKTSSV